MSVYRTLRRKLLTPGVSATKMDVRGFHVKDEPSRKMLETVGASFLEGYGYAAEARSAEEAEQRLEQIPVRFRGFGYEGAAMGFAVRDALGFGRVRHVPAVLAGRGDRHVYMVYVGVGWAMARVPRFRWARLTAPDPLLRWLVLDGYGFHQAYFATGRYVRRQYREPDFPWPADGPPGYAPRAIDQGVGRALWFVGGTDPDQVTALINRFDPVRRPDLYGGAGLAATYAGGADEAELTRFWEQAGPYRRNVAQGSAFAASARVRAGLVVPHNGLATRLFCGLDPDQAAKVTDEARPSDGDTARATAYERWREAVADHFTTWCRR